MAAVSQAMQQTPRASSLVESRSRLRNYFFLRRQLGPQYLDLLQFFSTIARLCAVNVEQWAESTIDGSNYMLTVELFLGFERFQRPNSCSQNSSGVGSQC